MSVILLKIIFLLMLGSCIRIVIGDRESNGSPGSTFSCPTGYVRVPANSAVGTTTDFCAAKYEMKDNGSGDAVSTAAGAPWVGIDWDDAITECDDLNTLNGVTAKYSLMTNPEWMTIARNVEIQNVNWLSGTAGVGMIARGHSDNFPVSGLAASTDDDGYANTVNAVTDPIGGGREQRRTLTLSNGEVIWDFAGSVNEWIDWEIPGASRPYENATGVDFLYHDLKNLDVNVGPVDLVRPSTYRPFFSTLDRTNGLGSFFSAGSVPDSHPLRGGAYNYGPESGIYAIDLNYYIGGHLLGFRCVYHP